MLNLNSLSEFVADQIPPLEEIQAELARRRTRSAQASEASTVKDRCKRLTDFVREAWPVLFPGKLPDGSYATPYVHGWHIEEICAHLEAITFGKFLAAGQRNRLVTNCPPGTMKSLLISVFYPAWEWSIGLTYMQYLTASFKWEFCVRDSNRFRLLVQSDWYQSNFDVKITRANDGKVANSDGGHRETVPFGSMMGGRAHRVIIDDPHSVDQTDSEADRERSIKNFRERIVVSMNDPQTSAIIIVMQRLHQGDLTGEVLRLGGWVYFMLPMRFEVERASITPFGMDRRTREGEMLFPERFPEHVVDFDEKQMTAYAVAGQHQQRPQPRGGLMFKRHWFGMVDAVPNDTVWVRGWDLAASIKSGAAFTAGVKVGWSGREKRYYIADAARERVMNPAPLIRKVAESDRDMGQTVEISLPQDPGAAGLVQARAHVADLGGFTVRCSPETGEKSDRARPFAAQAEIGNVSMLRGPWNEIYLNEIESFPTGTYKDQVDASSRAFAEFFMRPPVVPIAGVVVSSTLKIHGSISDGREQF